MLARDPARCQESLTVRPEAHEIRVFLPAPVGLEELARGYRFRPARAREPAGAVSESGLAGLLALVALEHLRHQRRQPFPRTVRVDARNRALAERVLVEPVGAVH